MQADHPVRVEPDHSTHRQYVHELLDFCDHRHERPATAYRFPLSARYKESPDKWDNDCPDGCRHHLSKLMSYIEASRWRLAPSLRRGVDCMLLKVSTSCQK